MPVRPSLLSGFDRARALAEYAVLRLSPDLLGGLLALVDPVARHEAILAVPEAGLVEPQKYTAAVLRSQQFLIEQGEYRGVRAVRDFHARSIRADRKPDLNGNLPATVRAILGDSSLERAKLQTDMEYLYQQLWDIERTYGARTAMYFGVLAAVRNPADPSFDHTARSYAERLDRIFRRTETRLRGEGNLHKPRNMEDLAEIHFAICDKRQALYQADAWDPLLAIDAVLAEQGRFNCVSLAFVDAMNYLQLGIPAGILKVPEEEHSVLAVRPPFQREPLFLESTADDLVAFNRPYGEGTIMNYLGFVVAMSSLRIFEELKREEIDLAEAIEQLDRLKILTPHLPELYTSVGMSALSLGRTSGGVNLAYHNFQTALRLSRTYQFVPYLGMAKYCEAKGAFSRAVQYYQKVLNANPRILMTLILEGIKNREIDADEKEHVAAELMLAAVIEKINAETKDEAQRARNQAELEKHVRPETLAALKQRVN